MKKESIYKLWEAALKAGRKSFADKGSCPAIMLTISGGELRCVSANGITKDQFCQLIDIVCMDSGFCVVINECWLVKGICKKDSSIQAAMKSGKDAVVVAPSQDPDRKSAIVARLYNNDSNVPELLAHATVEDGKLGDWEIVNAREHEFVPWRFGDGEERIQ